MMTPHIVVNVDCAYRQDPGYDYEKGRFEQAGAELHLRPSKTEDEIAGACSDAEIVLLEYPHTPLCERTITRLPACRAIVKYGIGLENVDIEAASRAGIVVCNTAEFCLEEVSDHAIALMFAAARRVVSMDRTIRAGGWFNFPSYGSVRRLRNLKLGLVGFGRIGQAVARKLSSFGFEIVAHDPYASAGARALGVRMVLLDELLRTSDLISIHAPLNAETRGMIGESQLRAMKPTTILVNTSRGQICNESALIKALEERWISGAALDVFEKEPLPAGHPFTKLENVILTPHYSGRSEDSMVDLRTTVADSVEALIKGFWPPFPANPRVIPRQPLRPWAEFVSQAAPGAPA
jgi:D-3-phosphoglycerate dehydrogenase / 2-oxoglutarate reductase